MSFPFLDLKRRSHEIGPVLASALRRVVDSGTFVLGPEVAAFEAEFAAWAGAARCIGVASGTEALSLALAAIGARPGDEVITVPNTAVATVAAIRARGCRPVYCDIEEAGLTMDPSRLEGLITPRTRAVMPVHLYGSMADMAAILAIAKRHRLPVIEDCAQAHGASRAALRAGTGGVMGCFSFYPTKNLGALGDGGCVVTKDPDLDARLRRLRFYGEDETGRVVEDGGINSRLDEVQAALLRAQLAFVDGWNRRRRAIAARYCERLRSFDIALPPEAAGSVHVYHLFVARVRDRDRFRGRLHEFGVPSAVHYPELLYRHPAFRADADCPVAERIAPEIVSLPLNPFMTDEEVERTVAGVEHVLGG